jgi:hypothetical protein
LCGDHYRAFDALRNLNFVTQEDAPACDRHESRVPMRLRTMHSDSSQPDVVVGLFECPECGHERRQPIRTGEAA